MSFRVGPGEKGRLHVFHLIGDDWPPEPEARDVTAAIGENVDPRYVFVAEMKALAGVGLTGFMVEGLYANEADLEVDKNRLDSLEGWAAVVLSKAFHGAACEGTSERLNWVGSYGEHKMAVAGETPKSAAASGVQATASASTPARGRMVLVVALILACLALLPLLVLL
ncbi:MAG: hypothetical protein AAFX00_02640 [Pseudomonadota bacterium]